LKDKEQGLSIKEKDSKEKSRSAIERRWMAK